VTTYSFSTISDPNAGSEGTIVTGVNASGEVAGDYYDSGADPPAAGSSAAATALLVQAMASFGASAAVTSAPGAVPGGADASPQSLLTLPQPT
jgi:hypothetical protein